MTVRAISVRSADVGSAVHGPSGRGPAESARRRRSPSARAGAIAYAALLGASCVGFDPYELKTATVKGQILRAATYKTDADGEQNTSYNVQDQSVDWSRGTLYALLLPADVVDAPDAGPKSNPPINDFGVRIEAARRVANPFDENQKAWLDPDGEDTARTYAGVFDRMQAARQTFVGLMSPVKEGSPVTLLEIQGVEDGTYDLLVWADVEQGMHPDGEGRLVSARGVGCIAEDGVDCVDGAIGRPSNGDVVYMLDNVVVSSATKERYQGLYFPAADVDLSVFYPANSPAPNPCVGDLNKASGDHDFWDEWICLDQRFDLDGDPYDGHCGSLRDQCWDDVDDRAPFPDERE